MARCDHICLAFLALAVLIASTVWLVAQCKHPTPPRYYAAVDAVSGLDDRRLSRGRWPPNLEFTLSLGVQSQSPLWGRMCLERGTAVTVAYHGVPLAHGALGREVCAQPWMPWKARWTTAVARPSKAERTRPGFVVDGLAADTRRGVLVFDVALRIPATGHVDDDGEKIVSCVARQVGDAASAACDVRYE